MYVEGLKQMMNTYWMMIQTAMMTMISMVTTSKMKRVTLMSSHYYLKDLWRIQIAMRTLWQSWKHQLRGKLENSLLNLL